MHTNANAAGSRPAEQASSWLIPQPVQLGLRLEAARRPALLHPHSSLATCPLCPQSEGGFPDFDADVRSNYLFNSSITGIDAADAILLVRRRGERGEGARQSRAWCAAGARFQGIESRRVHSIA